MNPIQNAIEKTLTIVAETPLSGAQFTSGGLRTRRGDDAPREGERIFDLRWERGWGCSCSLAVNLTSAEQREKKIWVVEAEISWSSTGHSIASALCATTLHREVIDLAAKIECAWAYPLIEHA